MMYHRDTAHIPSAALLGGATLGEENIISLNRVLSHDDEASNNVRWYGRVTEFVKPTLNAVLELNQQITLKGLIL